MLLLFAGIAWPAIQSILWPSAISATGVGAKLVYEFRSAMFSEEFKELNSPVSESITVDAIN
jgi:hypothetical protein